MIKLNFCLRRLPSLSSAEFQTYWLEKHAPLVREYAKALRIIRYVQTHYLAETGLQASLDARGPIIEPYDGIAQLWWANVDDILTAGTTPEGRAAGRALLTDERNFIDLPNSPIFFAQEHVIVG
ncbi:MAG: EthD domain-containing protein [Sphingorhabdus sp.]